jgi:hypothetical protein
MKAPPTTLVKVYLLPGQSDEGFMVFRDKKTGMDYIMVPENEQTKHLRLETNQEIKVHCIPHIFDESECYIGNRGANLTHLRTKSFNACDRVILNIRG